MSELSINNSLSLRPAVLPKSAWIGHIPFAAWLIEEHRPNKIVELGTHNGASYLAFCQAVVEIGLETKCFAIDTWEGDEHAGSYGEEVYGALSAYHKQHYAAFSQLMRMSFDQALSYFDDGSVDLLHIDGLHTYEAVSHDFKTWLPKLSGRGIILFHDTMVRERGFGVWKLWNELSGLYPSFEFGHSHGLGVLLVGADLPESVRSLATRGGTGTSIGRLFDRLAGAIDSSAQIEAMRAKVLEAEQKVGEAKNLVAIRELDIRNLEEGMVHLKAGIAHQEGLVAERERKLRDLNMVLGQRDVVVDRLSEAVAARDAARLELDAQAAQRDALLESLSRSYGDCQRDLLEARLTVSHQALQLKDRERQILDMDARINGMAHQHGAAITELRAAQQRGEIALQHALNLRQNSLDELHQALLDEQRRVQDIFASSSWRVTKPLRWFARHVLGRGNG